MNCDRKKENHFEQFYSFNLTSLKDCMVRWGHECNNLEGWEDECNNLEGWEDRF